MKLEPLAINGAYAISLTKLGDARGHFARTFCADIFSRHGLSTNWAQMNLSRTAARGAVRGMHFQRDPHAEAKLIRCTKGRAFDVLVDLRADSPTFGTWTSVTLDADEQNAVYIPEGCAHGFQTMAPDTELHYCHSRAYAPEAEGGVSPTDPDLAIDWPLPITQLSDRDAALPRLKDLVKDRDLP